MDHFDIETYLDGGLSGTELKAFETEMRNNPDFAQEVKLMRQLTEDIDMQTMREEVSAALKEGPRPSEQKPGNGKWIRLILALAVFSLAAFWIFNNSADGSFPPAENLPAEISSQSTEVPSDLPIESNENTSPEPASSPADLLPPGKPAKPPVNQKTTTDKTDPLQKTLLPPSSFLPCIPRPGSGDRTRTMLDGRPCWTKFGTRSFRLPKPLSMPLLPRLLNC